MDFIRRLKKGERVLLVLCVLLVVVCMVALIGDDFDFDRTFSNAPKVGRIQELKNDSRYRFNDNIVWRNAKKEQNVLVGDAVFAGDESQIIVALDSGGEVTIGENSLVVFREIQSEKVADLDDGRFRIKSNGQVKVAIGGQIAVLDGKNSELQIQVAKDRPPEIKVVKGRATVAWKGKKPEVAHAAPRPPPSPPPIAKVAPPPPPAPPQRLGLLALQPKASAPIYASGPYGVPFVWSYGGQQSAKAGDIFTLEFSQTQDFELLYATKAVEGQTHTELKVGASMALFYRVRGPKDELSSVEQFRFVRMQVPVVKAPTANRIFYARGTQTAPVRIAFEPIRERPRYWFQVASEQNFETVLINESSGAPNTDIRLPAGSYFLRARADYGEDQLTAWSQGVPFDVVSEPNLNLAFKSQVTIPNKPYPENLYSAPASEVSQHLANEGLMGDYFSLVKEHADLVMLDFGDGQRAIPAPDFAWPVEKIAPGQYKFRLQLQRRGKIPSRWSHVEKVSIFLEPPVKTSVSPRTDVAVKYGSVATSVKFTPLLFAAEYETYVSRSDDFKVAKVVRSSTPEARVVLGRKLKYHWKARALNKHGQPISAFSPTYTINSTLFEPEIILAKKEEVRQREIAAVNESIARVDKYSGAQFKNYGFWSWLGTGGSFINYRQSVPGRAAMNSASIKPLGAYVELGWGKKDYGVVATYKSTPGKVFMKNAIVDNTEYSWDTFSLEGMYCPIKSRRFLGKPATVGVRAGLQYQDMPFLFLNEAATLVEMKDIKMITASLGAVAEGIANRWHYYGLFRLQRPVSASTTGGQVKVTPTIAFDGSLGTAYALSPRAKAGLFWYGQWHQFDFRYTADGFTNTGKEFLFSSSLDLRFGYDF